MKIYSPTDTLERGSLGAESTFEIKKNARAFQILSSNLYRNKIQAVIRELSCNAWDSHVEAGKKGVPFEVHLPTVLEPWFSVTDYGVGLDDQGVKNLYTTYFSSSKTQSNELIGALGLGSKSPFAYTNTFDVEAVKNGVVRHYVMFVNEEGEPSLAPMGESATDRPNGVSVKLPVSKEDMDTFRYEAEYVFSWFKDHPTITGNKRYSRRENVVALQGSNWKLLEHGYGYSSGTAMAQMGNVAYPIQHPKLSKFDRLLRYKFVLDFAIGELDVAASREELSYDPVTVETLIARLTELNKELVQTLENKFSNATTLWEARCLLRDTLDNYQTRDIYHLAFASNTLPTWNNKPVHVDPHLWVKAFDVGKAPRIHQLRPSYNRVDAENDIHPRSDWVIVRKDTFDTNTRVREYRDSQKSGKVYVIVHAEHNGTPLSDLTFNKFIEEIGNPPYILGSSLPASPRSQMIFKGQAWTGKAQHTWSRRDLRKSDNWGKVEPLTSDVDAPTYYVINDAQNPSCDGSAVGNFDEIVRGARQLGLIPRDCVVWGINKTNAKKIDKNPNWIEVVPHIKTKLTEFCHNNQVSDYVVNKEGWDEIARCLRVSPGAWTSIFGHFDNSVGKFAHAWNKMGTARKETLDTAAAMCRYLQMPMDKPTAMNSVKDLFDTMLREYPLLRLVTTNRDGVALQDFVPYIDALDKVKNIA